MGSHRRRCSFSHIGGFGVINCATGSNASAGGLPFHTHLDGNSGSASIPACAASAIRQFNARLFGERTFYTGVCLLLLFEALTPVNSLFVFSKFPVIARAIPSFDPPGKSLMSLILSETWRRIRRDSLDLFSKFPC